MPNTTPPELEGVDVVRALGDALPPDASVSRLRRASRETRRLLRRQASDGPRFRVPHVPDALQPGARRDGQVAQRRALDRGRRVRRRLAQHRSTGHAPRPRAEKRAQVVDSYAACQAARREGWHFLVGDEANIRKVTDAVGFKYRYDERQKQYAHPAAIYLLTPEGQMARYLYGIEYAPADVRLGAPRGERRAVDLDDGEVSSLLLPLRPAGKALRARGHERDAPRRCRHPRRSWAAFSRSCGRVSASREEATSPPTSTESTVRATL